MARGNQFVGNQLIGNQLMGKQGRCRLGVLFASIMVLGLGLWTLFMQPLGLLTAMSPLICPNAIYAVETDIPVVALTIDDGPDISVPVQQSTTTQMLDLLDLYHAQATFFLISDKLQRSSGSALAQRIIEDGHELGNHFTTDMRSITATELEFQQGLQDAEQRLATFSPTFSPAFSFGSSTPTHQNRPDHQTHQNPQQSQIKWFRPAGGWCSQSNAQTTQDQRYQTALGTIWPYDTHVSSVALASRQILQTVHPGAIIILHDGGKGDGTSDRGQRAVHILQTILPELQARGYQVTTLSALASYGSVVQNPQVLPKAIDRVWQRAIAGWIVPSVTTVPPLKQWGMILAISTVGAIAILWIGFRTRFLRYQWATPPPSQSRFSFYSQIAALAFFLPALAEEAIFRLMLLPSPREITDVISRGQWVECAVSLILYIGVHPLLNGPLRDRLKGTSAKTNRRAIAYKQTFCSPIFLGLTTVVGIVCTILYLLWGSLWPPVLFHWCVVTVWLLGLGGYQTLHPIKS